MRRCRHEAYCKHAPKMCRGFLGDPIAMSMFGCPLVPTTDDVREAQSKAGGLSRVAPTETGTLSLTDEEE